MELRLENKVALVTDASRGIGRAIVQLFADSGAKVVVHYNKNSDAAKDVLNTFAGNFHSVVQADISDPGEVEGLISEVLEKYGRIDCLVNNAGVFNELDIMSLSYEQWQDEWNKTISLNLTGAANLSFLVAKAMKGKGGCKIINISSRGAFRGEPNAPAYGASKAGMNSFGQSFASALAPYDIYVYTIAPGFVETDMFEHAKLNYDEAGIIEQSPLKRIAKPEEIARIALFLAAEGSEYMTGCIIDANGASYLRT